MASLETSTNKIDGTDTADNITATEANDAVIAGAGDDRVVGGGGDDYVLGGQGEDTLIGDAPSSVEFEPSSIEIVEDYTMTMTFDYEGAGYQNSLGMYRVDAETGKIKEAEIAWENASLQGSGGSLVGGQSSVSYDVKAGEKIGFFIIGNGYGINDFASLGAGSFEFVNDDGSEASIDSTTPTLRHVASDGTVTVMNGNVYHSASTQPDHGLNADGIDHTEGHSGTDVTNFQIGFEDLYNGGDMDFDDVMFTVEVGATNGAHILGAIDDGTGGGDDRLEGRAGEDQIEGNSGDDLLVGGGASTEWSLVDGKWVYDGSKVDPNAVGEMVGDDDVIVGGTGDDVLIGNGGNDALYGGAGEDRFNGGYGDDRAYGGADDDVINLQQGDDYAEGGSGGDIINAGEGDDVIYGDDKAENMLRTTGEESSFADYAAMDAWDSYTDETTGKTTIAQEVMTEAGQTYEMTFDLAANLAAGATSGTIEVLFNGEVIETIDTTSGVFESHTVSFTGDGGPGSLSFRNVETSAEAQAAAPVYDTSGPIMSYDTTLTVNGAEVDVAGFAPGQSNLYQVISGEFKVFDTEAGDYQDVGEPFGFKVNAIGFNVEDDLIYGIAKSNGSDSEGNAVSKKDLVAIDADGNTYRIGETPVSDYVGDFDDEGNLWTFDSSVNRITKIDVDNLDADGNPAVENFYLPADMFAGRTYDIAYNAEENSFYAVEPPKSQGASGTVHKIDVSEFDGTNEPVITSVEISGTLTDGGMQTGMAKGAYGAVFMDADGNLYAGLNKGDHDFDSSTDVSGAMYKFELDFESGQGYAELLADSQSTGSNDGASDPRALDPFAEQDTTSSVLIKSPELVSASGGNDDIRAGDGNDTVFAGAGDDLVHGNDGDDTISGDAGNDKIFAGTGDDTVEGGTGNDYIEGGAGDDTLSGGYGNDRLKGGEGNDTVDGGAGDDKVYGDAGDDTLTGGAGNDTLDGGSGDDVVDGGAGNDTVRGGSGDDILTGGGGSDKIVGGSGSDVLEGGAGNDHLWGGNWSADGATDTFAYSKGGGRDIIHDFESEHDQIDLTAYDLSYEDIQDRMIDHGWALEINLEGIDKSGAGDKILLKSVKADDLDSDNFLI
ncbi:MAG: DUF4114 domain-containing protein [Pseudomonadota bacterium]